MSIFPRWLTPHRRPENRDDAIIDYLRHGSGVFVDIDLEVSNEPQREAIELLSYAGLFEVRRIYSVMRFIGENYELEFILQATGNYYESGAVQDATRSDWPQEWGNGPVQEIWGPITKARLTETGRKGQKLLLSGEGGHIPQHLERLSKEGGLPPAQFDILSKKVKQATPSAVAVAVAQANPVINVQTAPETINITIQQPESNLQSESGDKNGQRSEDPAGKPVVQRQTEWSKVYELLKDKGIPGDDGSRDRFVEDYNKQYAGKSRQGKPGDKWPRLTRSILGQRISDYRKK